jgi:TRAP-type C4-dicarboxylate transport system permease small subunit
MLNDLDVTAQNAKITTQLQGAPTIYQIIGIVVNIVLSGLGVIFLLLMIFGGIRWMTAGGNEETVRKASSLIFQATVGLIIVLSAFLLTNFVIFRIINTATIGNQNATTTQNIAPNP